MLARCAPLVQTALAAAAAASGVLLAPAPALAARGARLPIDPVIQGRERAVISRVLNTLEPEDRENVVFFDTDGHVYSNRAGLAREFVRPRRVAANVYEDVQGRRLAVPELTAKPLPQPLAAASNGVPTGALLLPGPSPIAMPASVTPPTGGNTGPYRRVYSNPGYPWMAAHVHLAGGSEIHEASGSSGDTGFTYAGGWGDYGGAVDAGFQHSPTYDNWSLLINAEGSGMVYDSGTRFKSAQDVFLKFYVSSNNNIATIASGYDVNNTAIQRTVVQTMGSGYGWYANGTGVVLKRMTSIGQTAGYQNFSTGSYVNSAHWYSSIIGSSSTTNHTWAGADTGGYTTWPDAAHVIVSYVNASEETDNIHCY